MYRISGVLSFLNSVSYLSFYFRFVYLELPSAAKTPCTRIRWWQPVFSGEGYDQWAIDDIIILAEKMKQIIPVVNPTLPQVTNEGN